MILPTVIRVYSNLAAAALRTTGAGGWLRSWLLVRALDTDGSGKVKRDDVMVALHELGVILKTARRWVDAAIAQGVLIVRYEWLRYRNPAVVGRLLGVDRVGDAVELPTVGLFGRGWRSLMYQAALAGLAAVRKGTPLSRRTLQSITGLSRATQRRHEKRGVKSTRNLAETGLTADLMPGLREFGMAATLFSYQGKVYKRLPDTRQPMQAQRVGRGRSRKYNAMLVNKAGQAFNGVRVYHNRLTTALLAYRKLCRQGEPRATFHSPQHEPGGVLWQAYTTAEADLFSSGMDKSETY
ncbi:MAG: hypothetical protein U1B80_06780 [Anaerolineaceae bacterium]|nr:hypothetical protein [Anaerolineaceae bacterium]